jgi:phosphoribosylaminoimidazole carboxylase (NCAIR synthetase)
MDGEENQKSRQDEKKVLAAKEDRIKAETAYNKNNIKSTDQEEVKVSQERSKIIERVTYKNGVVKSRLVGIIKKGKVIHNAGLDKKWTNPNKNALKK